MEVSELLKILRIKLADPTFNDDDEGCLFSTDELVYYINNALKEAALRGKLFRKDSSTIDVKIDVINYPVPAGMINVSKLIRTGDNKDVWKVQEVDFKSTYYQYTRQDDSGGDIVNNDWRNDKGVLPEYFMQSIVNNRLTIYPIPTADSTLKVRGTYYPDTVEVGDDIPTELNILYQHDLIYWVLYEAYSKTDSDTYDPARAQENEGRFTQCMGHKLPADQFEEMLQYPDDPGSMRDY